MGSTASDIMTLVCCWISVVSVVMSDFVAVVRVRWSTFSVRALMALSKRSFGFSGGPSDGVADGPAGVGRLLSL